MSQILTEAMQLQGFWGLAVSSGVVDYQTVVGQPLWARTPATTLVLRGNTTTFLGDRGSPIGLMVKIVFFSI